MTAATMLLNAPTNVCPIRAPQGRWNIAPILAGTNDAAGGLTLAQAITSIRALHNLVRNCGFKTIAMTVTPCGTCTVGAQTVITNLDVYIRQYWSTFADAFVDLAINPTLSNSSNSTYYSDQVHWTTAGATIVAGLVSTAINQITEGTPGTYFTSLDASTPNGTVYYCPDCAVGATCAGAGTGAIAKRLNGAWVCQ
jgi:hypothetical protein